MPIEEKDVAGRLYRVEGDMKHLSQRVEGDKKALFQRIDKNDEMTERIHSLASDIKLIAEQLKMVTERLEYVVTSYDERLHNQGQRIGALETKPAVRWDNLMSQVITLIVAAAFGYFMSKGTL